MGRRYECCLVGRIELKVRGELGLPSIHVNRKVCQVLQRLDASRLVVEIVDHATLEIGVSGLTVTVAGGGED